jgi:uracil-DNA glycosylase family 4
MISLPDMLPITDDLVQGPTCHAGGITGLGNPHHGVMVIGIAPAADEMKQGRPLVGPTGKLFNDLTKAIGFPRDNMYITNMCCAYVPGKVKREHMNLCFPRVEREIRALKPRLIILLGTEVCQYWTDKTINQARGSVTWSPQYKAYVMPIIQPAALFHDDVSTNAQTDQVSNVAYDIVRDLRKIPDILKWPRNGRKNLVPYTTITSATQAQDILDNLSRTLPVAIDIETGYYLVDVMDVAYDEIVCLAISDGTNTWVGEARYFDSVQWPLDVKWTPHYGQFDMAMIHKRYGVWLPIVEDTLLMSYTCDERPGYHALKPLAREFEAAGFYEEKRTTSLQALLEYNAKDAAYTARLAQGKLRTWQQEEGTRGVYERLLIPAVNVFKEIKARGARVDATLIKELEREWGNERDTEQERIQQLAHDSGWPNAAINLGSWQQLSKMLYNVIGLEGCKRRCCYNRVTPSTDKEHLEALRGQHSFVDNLLTYRGLQHNYAIYVDGWYKHIRTQGLNHGRIHPDINLHGTATGRRSYAKPAVQTIPRPSNQVNKYGRLRQAIIPTSDDYEIAYVDYTRAEIYTAYAYSHDPAMWEALQKDYHLETAVNVMHKSRARMMADPDYKEEMRRIAKIVTFGIFYGMEAYTLSVTAEIPVPEAQAYINGVFANYKHYDRWYKETLRTLERTGEVTSITGRKRRFVMLQPNPRVLKQAVNFPIQSTAGDVTLQAVIRLHEPLKALDCHILFDVHDAIVFEISKKHRYEAMQLIHDVMESPPFPDIAPDFPCIPTEAYIGKSWGHAEKIKDFEAWRAA